MWKLVFCKLINGSSECKLNSSQYIAILYSVEVVLVPVCYVVFVHLVPWYIQTIQSDCSIHGEYIPYPPPSR